MDENKYKFLFKIQENIVQSEKNYIMKLENELYKKIKNNDFPSIVTHRPRDPRTGHFVEDDESYQERVKRAKIKWHIQMSNDKVSRKLEIFQSYNICQYCKGQISHIVVNQHKKNPEEYEKAYGTDFITKCKSLCNLTNPDLVEGITDTTQAIVFYLYEIIKETMNGFCSEICRSFFHASVNVPIKNFLRIIFISKIVSDIYN